MPIRVKCSDACHAEKYWYRCCVGSNMRKRRWDVKKTKSFKVVIVKQKRRLSMMQTVSTYKFVEMRSNSRGLVVLRIFG